MARAVNPAHAIGRVAEALAALGMDDVDVVIGKRSRLGSRVGRTDEDCGECSMISWTPRGCAPMTV